MKKTTRYLFIFLLCAVIVGVMLAFAPKPFASHVSNLPDSSRVAIYCRATDLPATNMGNGYLVECRLAQFQEIISHCHGVDGISARFAATQDDFDQIIRHFQLTVTSAFQDCNLVALCGHSRQITGGVYVDGKLTNLQVAFDGATLTLGYPMILDSY